MGFSMSFNKLNKVMAVATVLATIPCLAPKSAEAARFSGSPNCDLFDFTLDNSGNIEEARFTHDIDQDCQTEGKIFFDFKHGTLEHHPKIYKMDLSDFGLQDNFLGGKKYTSTLSGAETKSGEEVDLTLYFFVSPSKSNSINSFSDLIKFLTSHEFDIDSGPNHEFVSGIQFTNSFYFYCNMPNDCEISNNFQRFETSFQMVPEPGSTGSLLGIGFLGAALLLKRSKYSR